MTGSPKPYSPAVGDVVEFEYFGKVTRAIIGPFLGKTAPAAIWGIFPGNEERPTWTSIPDKTLTKVDFISGLSDVESVKDALKAYFAQPTFKIGDKVRVIKRQHSLVPPVGTVTMIEKIDRGGSIWLKGSGCTQPECLEPVNSRDDEDDLDW